MMMPMPMMAGQPAMLPDGSFVQMQPIGYVQPMMQQMPQQMMMMQPGYDAVAPVMGHGYAPMQLMMQPMVPQQMMMMQPQQLQLQQQQQQQPGGGAGSEGQPGAGAAHYDAEAPEFVPSFGQPSSASVNQGGSYGQSSGGGGGRGPGRGR